MLSKGHSAGALYVTLWAVGLIPDDELTTFHQDGTTLAGHPIAGWHERIAFATGSLGHGLGLAAGVALGKRLGGRPGQVYCLLSDGECEEGSIWEALLFARHHAARQPGRPDRRQRAARLRHHRRDRLAGAARAEIRGLGLPVAEIDGHDPAALDAALRAAARLRRWSSCCAP